MVCEVWDPFKLTNDWFCPEKFEDILGLAAFNVATIMMVLGCLGGFVQLLFFCCIVTKDCIEDVENGTRNGLQESQHTNAQNSVSILSPIPNISTIEGGATNLPPSYDEAVKP